jgi:hypothetical protein
MVKDIPGLGVTKASTKKSSLRRLHETAYAFISTERKLPNGPSFIMINSGALTPIIGTFSTTINRYLN